MKIFFSYGRDNYKTFIQKIKNDLMQNKTFRLFVNSTFSDFNEKRKLIQYSFSRNKKKYCRNNDISIKE